ncbi:MAG TPA: hypothetical protein VI216_05850, partial [Candidatus Acidoferrales bacterium]
MSTCLDPLSSSGNRGRRFCPEWFHRINYDGKAIADGVRSGVRVWLITRGQLFAFELFGTD